MRGRRPGPGATPSAAGAGRAGRRLGGFLSVGARTAGTTSTATGLSWSRSTPAPTILRVRLQPAEGADADRVWQSARDKGVHLLTEHKVGEVALERAEEPPQQSPGGKYRRVIPLLDTP
ncbi:hypothetical protein [Nonomuraea sp. NPDC046570]|uniref:hypothetical protein n=1 Tax=Nonomuraea sp. NPDC046570 TaxID=3155255 RepID=UPI0033C958BF